MSEVRQRLVASWLDKAAEDLAVARLLIRQERRLLGAGCYHCQQAAEKALKAWLTAKAVVFPKTHDLEVLLGLALDGAVGGQAELEDAARELTPLATAFRYPGDLAVPTEQEAEALLAQAEKLVNHVLRVLA